MLEISGWHTFRQLQTFLLCFQQSNITFTEKWKSIQNFLSRPTYTFFSMLDTMLNFSKPVYIVRIKDILRISLTSFVWLHWLQNQTSLKLSSQAAIFWCLSPHGWVKRLEGVEKDLYSYQITFNRYWKIHLIAKTAGLEGYLSVDVRTNDPHLKKRITGGKIVGREGNI